MLGEVKSKGIKTIKSLPHPGAESRKRRNPTTGRDAKKSGNRGKGGLQARKTTRPKALREKRHRRGERPGENYAATDLAD